MSTCYVPTNPIFQPATRLIASITNSNPAIVTTTFAHNYFSGTIVRLVLPIAVGMEQAQNKTGAITVTGATTFTIDIDTTNYAPFSLPISPSPHVNTCALVVPIGEVNQTLVAATRNTLGD